MTDIEIQRAQWAKWKRADYHRHIEARRLHKKLYFRRYRAMKRLQQLKEAA